MYNSKGKAVDVSPIVGQCEPYRAISPLLIRALFDDEMANEFISMMVQNLVLTYN